MKNVTILIPTRNRLDRLISMLNSIPIKENISVVVVCDDDMKTYEVLSQQKFRPIQVKLVQPHSGTVVCRNKYLSCIEGNVICATDSIWFNPGSIERAVKIFEEEFPDDDGVFAFSFKGIGSCTAIPLIGSTFLSRYPNKQLYYPGYFHFACQEISEFCKKLEQQEKKKFLYIDSLCTIEKPTFRDLTYVDARIRKTQDIELKIFREKNNLIWGWN
jgi:glycosyltransferase involved in cell wall biosynthesis